MDKQGKYVHSGLRKKMRSLSHKIYIYKYIYAYRNSLWKYLFKMTAKIYIYIYIKSIPSFVKQHKPGPGEGWLPVPCVCKSMWLQLKPLSFCTLTRSFQRCNHVGFSGRSIRWGGGGGIGIVSFSFVFRTCGCEQNDHCSTRMRYVGRAAGERAWGGRATVRFILGVQVQ